MSNTQKLRLDEINILAGTQSRAKTNDETVKEYKEALEQGAEFPPVIVFSDGSTRGKWLADGFHRYLAHQKAGLAEIECDTRPGTLCDAVLFSAGANGTHGLPRTNADKRSAVQMVLANGQCEDWSDRQIARHCKVSNNFVGDVRRAICHPMTDEKAHVRTVTRSGVTYEQNTANIGQPTAPAVTADTSVSIESTNTDVAAKPREAAVQPPTSSVTNSSGAAPASLSLVQQVLDQQAEQAQAGEPPLAPDVESEPDVDPFDQLMGDYQELARERDGLLGKVAEFEKHVQQLKQHIDLLTRADLAAQVDGLVRRAEAAEFKFEQLSGRNRDLQGKVRDTQLDNESLTGQMAKIRKALGVEANRDILPTITARRAA